MHVVVIMGSKSDHDKVQPCIEQLSKLGVKYRIRVCSAHRSPMLLDSIMLAQNDVGAYICAAGMAAHLAGAVAARTVLPVIGLPLSGSALSGVDALYSTVQMPPGIPVATVAIDGAKNAACLAAEILALSDPVIRKKLVRARKEMDESVTKADRGMSVDTVENS